MWSSLGTIIYPENAHNDLIKFIWDVHGTCATPVCATRIFITLKFSCKSGAHCSCRTCEDNLSTNRVRFDDGEIMFTCELHNFCHVIWGRALASDILFSAKRSALMLD